MATRLRQTFKYPANEDEDGREEGMDEQEQEHVISSLSTTDTRTTRLYTLILLPLPLLPILLYIPRLFDSTTVLPSLVSIVSLLASAYALYFLPLPPVRISITHTEDLKSGSASAKGKSAARDASGERTDAFEEEPRNPYLPAEVDALVRAYLIPVNAVLCGLLCLWELSKGQTWSEGMQIGGGYLPALIMVVVMWARRELRVVDMGELERLRYRFKGA